MAKEASSAHIEPTVVSNIQEAGSSAPPRSKILIVDDDPVVRKIVLELLNNRYTVILASTGVQLPELLQKHHPDLVILDVPSVELWAYRVGVNAVRTVIKAAAQARSRQRHYPVTAGASHVPGDERAE